MQGRRRETPEGPQNFLPDDPQRGDYWRDSEGHWWAYVPNNGVGALSNHQITEHEDGTITVSPSILVHGEHGWHGYLERGVWREV